MPTTKNHSFFYKNGLSIFFLFLFLITLGGQALTGWKDHNQELKDKHAKEIGLSTYLKTGHFISATFENFESEFLQMSMYVLITIKLRQIGSSESKAIDEEEEVDREPVPHKDAPWPVKKGGFILALYSNSLSLAFLILFLISWGLHLLGSYTDFNVEQFISHKPKVTIFEFLLQPRFWFETFQNWQSEFLSVFSIVFLTIYLRQKGSPESKPVDAPNMQTGK
ncbi:MAG: hypothetical protein JWQ28_1760 [Pedobacter sp.]|jgi:hypothetical protein|nr:hypothetical protein [Pedobacter sp.]